MAEEIRQLSADELRSYVALAAQAFQVEPANAARTQHFVRAEESYGLFAGGQMRAALTVFDMEMWLGVAPVPAGGLAGVVTPPEWRRQGVIGHLLRETLDIMR